MHVVRFPTSHSNLISDMQNGSDDIDICAEKSIASYVEIRVDSGNGRRELRGKRVPINIKIQRLIYVDNIHTKHAYH